MRCLLLAVLTTLTACSSSSNSPAIDADVVDDSPGNLVGDFEMTFYWVAIESEHPGPIVEEIYDNDCNLIAEVSADFGDALRLEGTGKLDDGRVLNYWGSCSCATSPCFFEVGPEYPWGQGVANRALVPFRSLAVDTDDLAIGTSLYVAEFDGLQMPGEAPDGGYVHDGCVVADDIGGAITQRRLDWFVGLRSHWLSLSSKVGSSPVTVYRGGGRCL